MSSNTSLSGLPAAQLSQLSQLPLSLAGAGIYPVMTPSLSPYSPVQATQNHCNMGLSQPMLTPNGVTNLPKLFVPSVKVRIRTMEKERDELNVVLLLIEKRLSLQHIHSLLFPLPMCIIDQLYMVIYFSLETATRLSLIIVSACHLYSCLKSV